jgi:hypothetical protein
MQCEQGGWRVQVTIQGVRDLRAMSTKAEAIACATTSEAEIRVGKATGIQAGRTVGDAFDRYEKEVSYETGPALRTAAPRCNR